MTPSAPSLRLAAAALVVALAALPASAGATLAPYVPGEVLVKFKDGTSAAGRAASIAALAHTPARALDGAWARVHLRPGETVEEAVAGYVGDPAVEWVQPNYVYRALAVPADPEYGQQWALRNTGQAVASSWLQGAGELYVDTPRGVGSSNPGTAGADIGAEGAWDLVTDCSSVVVAVVDSGVNYLHQDLAPNMWSDPAGRFLHGADLVDGDEDPLDAHGHGTHVAGIIAARANGVGTVGVCWSARIMAVRVLDATGAGTSEAVLLGLAFATEHGARVINMSLGGGSYDAAFASAVDAAVNAGVVVVVAAGNEGSDNDATPTYPCSFPNPGIVCVAALDQNLDLATFSNHGARSVDVGAPGTNILSAWAGTETVIAEPLTAGWTFTSTSGTGFGYVALHDRTGAVAANAIADPVATQRYATVTDDRAWKSFDVSGADVVTMELYADVDVSAGDYLQVACRPGGADPFATGGVVLERDTNVHTGGWVPAGFDLAPCRGASASLGLQLQSSAPQTAQDLGVTIAFLKVFKLTRNGTSYTVASGTSMAAPVVAGVAALLRAHEPGFTPEDVADVLVGAARRVPSLAGKVRAGGAVDAAAALAYVHPPRGLAATVSW